jgi:hypothetical protein
MRFVISLLLAASLLPAPQAHGDAASKERKIQELLTIMHFEDTNRRMVQAEEVRIENESREQLTGVTLEPDQKESYDKFQRQVVNLLRESASWKVLEPDFIKLYADTYSEEEIDGILAFYHSPVGQAMLAKTPELTEKSIEISRHRMAALEPKIQRLVDQFMSEVR